MKVSIYKMNVCKAMANGSYFVVGGKGENIC